MSASLDDRARALLAAGDTSGATTIVLRELGPELCGFLGGVLGQDAGDEVFSSLSIRLWQSLAGFEGRCTLRTWSYVLARHELGRFRKGMRRDADRVPISQFEDVLAAARNTTRSALAAERYTTLTKLRDELPVEDRTLLILRVDRNLSWDEIALAFADNPESFSDVDRKREAARLRKRFQLVKQRLVSRIRAASASPPAG